MTIDLQIDRLTINAAQGWDSNTDSFRQLLERALADELRSAFTVGTIDSHEIMRVDLPPIVVADSYDLHDLARSVARRVVQSISIRPE
ncbi:MAG: hypothetical protein EOM24_11670 [Chloroflexia bacterium]|nr:hypothetical protein [Chloroflexia bacterium]